LIISSFHFASRSSANLKYSLPVKLFRGIELTKVSIYINDKVWSEFKKEVFQKYGSLRKISNEVETLLRSLIVEDAVVSGFKKIGVETKGTISSSDIKAKRPILKGLPSEEIIREMRQKRVAETLPRH
ncbi:MAG: hypothetical protein QMD23_01020, partial [Candidatus Bathyarchaeia archaeon]|nr:hypothetical protein [Candidatus Bathyarchaeia archaeon]